MNSIKRGTVESLPFPFSTNIISYYTPNLMKIFSDLLIVVQLKLGICISWFKPLLLQDVLFLNLYINQTPHSLPTNSFDTPFNEVSDDILLTHTVLSTELTQLTTFSDTLSSGRFIRFTNPMVEYEYRKGTYFTVWADRFPSLLLSTIELGRNDYFPKWFKSLPFKKLFKKDLDFYITNLTSHKKINYKSLSDS